MSCQSLRERRMRILILFGALLTAVMQALAAPQAVLPFTARTWADLEQAATRPMVVVFSTTDCAHCPKVIDDLADAIGKSHSRIRLVVVVMDGAGKGKALHADPHYRKAKELYVFADDDMKLRYSINRDWRGLTPYVALIPPDGAPSFHVGYPSSDALPAFLAR